MENNRPNDDLDLDFDFEDRDETIKVKKQPKAIKSERVPGRNCEDMEKTEENLITEAHEKDRTDKNLTPLDAFMNIEEQPMLQQPEQDSNTKNSKRALS